MNVINKSVSDLRFKIPKQILEAVFVDKSTFGWRQNIQQTSIEENILATVIRPRVLVDCNLVGGTEASIPLARAEKEQIDPYNVVFRIPKDLTDGRSILSVSSVSFNNPGNYGNNFVGLNGNNTLLRMGQAVMDAMGSIPNVSTSEVRLIGENVVLVKNQNYIPYLAHLVCTLCNDDTLSNISPRSYKVFAKLFEYAVKSYIFNELVIDMDIGKLYAGQDLSRFKEIVDSYADSEELYETHLREVVGKVSFMNDQTAYTKLLKTIIGGNR